MRLLFSAIAITFALSSASVFAQTDPGQQPDLGCTLTQGYWKNHEDHVASLLGVDGTILLGTNAYTAAQLDTILGTPDGGDALLKLAHQLIAAKLNVLNGADDSGIASEIANADSLIGALVPGTDSVDPSSDLGQDMVASAAILDDFNNGLSGVPHCEDDLR